MKLKIKQFLAITGLTAIEAIHQPIFLLLSATCILLISLTPQLLVHQFGEEGKLARDSGLAFHFVFGLFIAGYAACSSLARELRGGTASAVLSKPVSREVFFLAKFTGVVSAVIAFSICAAIATLLSERIVLKFYDTPELLGFFRDKLIGWLLLAVPFTAFLAAGVINYVKRRPFGSMAFGFLFVALCAVLVTGGFFNIKGELAPFDLRVEWRILPVSLLITFALIVLSAIAITLSTWFSTVPTMVICSLVFIIGLMSDYLFSGKHTIVSSPAAGAFIYRILPNWQYFWIADALNGGGIVPAGYIVDTAIYALVYSAGVLFLGMSLFRHVEIK